MLNRSDFEQYQNTAYGFANSHGSSLLALEMGLGKTVVSATYHRDLIYSTKAERCLVVAPKKVALNTWPDEFAKWSQLQEIKYSQMTGLDPRGRAAAARNLQDFNIINRENLMWLIDFWKRDWPYDSIILDEAKWCCNGQTFKQLRKVRKYIDYATLLSGTPAPSGHIDLFGQAWMVDQGERLGVNITSYRNKYFNKHPMGFGYKIKGKEQEAEIERLMGEIALYMAADDHIDLPPIKSNTIAIPLPQKLRNVYDQFKEDFIVELETGTILAESDAAKSNKLLQFCNGAVYDENKGVHQFHNEKLDMMAEVLKDTESPVLCAYSYKHDLPKLTKRFPNAVVLDDNPATVKKWNAGKIQLLICHPASAGHGLNLQFGGNTIIWFGLTWSLELYWQFMYRLKRRGQKASTIIAHHLTIKDSIEDNLLRALYTKGITQDQILEAMREAV